jgi:hypothetical protein
MAERVFALKLHKAGFSAVWFGEKVPFGVDRAALFPLFTDEIVDLMRKLIPPERQRAVAISVIAKARKPKAVTR